MKNSDKPAGRKMSKFFTWVFLPGSAAMNLYFYFMPIYGPTSDSVFDKFYNPLDNWLNLIVGCVCLLYAIIRIKEDLTS